jgi:putative restriction endonuclease
MDDDLFHYLNHTESRASLSEVLLQSCFSEQARASLIEQIAMNADAYNYSLELEQRAHSPLIGETLAGYNYKPEVRDQGFRRIVVTTYDHRCALCGIRIVTPDGHTVVEAAHIVPWSKSRNDDIRNGMALCRLCHWGFDEGMLGVSDNYTVITSRAIGLDQNFPGFLQTLSGRSIIPPTDRNLWPAQQYLATHRKEWRL